jgi:hypothetical protein
MSSASLSSQSLDSEVLLRRPTKSSQVPPAPSDALNASHFASPVPSNVLSSCFPRFTRILALSLFVLTMSLVAPLFVYFERVGLPPFRFAFWRHQVMFFVFLFPALYEYKKLNAAQRALLYDKKIYLAGAARALSLGMFVFSLYYTTTSRASLFASLDGIFLVLWFYLTSRPVSRMEIVGVLVCFSGLAVCEFLSLSLGVGENNLSGITQLIGDLLAAGCCTFIAYEIVLSNELRRTDNIPLFIFSFLINFSGLFVFCILTVITEKTSPLQFFSWMFEFSSNSTHFFSIIFIGIAVDAVDLIGFNFAVGEFSPLLISSIQLLEPGVTAIASYMLRLEDLPAWNTILGFVLVTTGIGIQTRGEQLREEEEERKEKRKAELIITSDEENGDQTALLSQTNEKIEMIERRITEEQGDISIDNQQINGKGLIQRSEAVAVDKIGRTLN